MNANGNAGFFKKVANRFFGTIRGKLALLLIAVVVPILIVQVIIYCDRIATYRQAELNASMAIARASAESFRIWVDDILNQQLAIGLVLSAFESLPAEALLRQLNKNKAFYPFLLDLMWVSPEGRIIASSVNRSAGADVSDRPFFREIISGRDWSLSNLCRCGQAASPVFTVSRAIRKADGRLAGIAVSKVLADKLEAVFSFKQAAGSSVTIIDGSGRGVIRYPKANWTWQDRDYLKRISPLKKVLAGSELAEMLVYAGEKKRYICGLAPIGSIGWAVEASSLEDRALAPVFSQLGYHAALFAAAVLVSALVFWRIAGSISDPMKRLQSHATDLSGAAPRPLTDFKGPREIVELSRTLDFMVLELSSKIGVLAQSEKRSREQLQRLMAELTICEQRERRRLAEILHDHLQQFLIAAVMNCRVLSAAIGTDDQKQIARNIENLLEQSIQASRSLTAELSPPVLQRGRLSAALDWLADWMRQNHGLAVEMQTDSDLDPEREEISLLLFQSVRELLLNVVKHAGVNTARVEMSRDAENRLRVSVADQGAGFDPQAVWKNGQAGGGFGLFSIRERLTLIGGSLEVESAPGRGAVFALVVPP